MIPPQFHETHGFREGLAPVVLDGKWGFIDVRGTMVIKPRYDMVPADSNGAYVRDGKAIVLKDGWWLEIDSSGPRTRQARQVKRQTGGIAAGPT